MMKQKIAAFAALILVMLACGPLTSLVEEDEPTEVVPTAEREPTNTPRPTADGPAPDTNTGTALITGEVEYTNPFFTTGIAQPLVILEDQAGFIDRDKDFIFPVESQTLGQITSDFYTSPFTYSLSLPIAPQGSARDVDNDDIEEAGVMVFAVAYWNNVFGDPYLEERDLGGGGWSTAYASTEISDDPEFEREIVGGYLVVYAPNDQQSFPSSFGDDMLLFTEDDPAMDIPGGWSVINLDTEPFEIIRDREVDIDLIEPESAALIDYSDQDYLEAYDNMFELMRTRYAFTENKGIDWEALNEEFRPRFEEANSTSEYAFALRDFLWSIPDGHINLTFIDPLINAYRDAVVGGFGVSLVELDDGRVLVQYVVPDSAADEAGIERGAEVTAINGTPIVDAIDEVLPWTSPFSTDHNRRLEQVRHVTRFPLGEDVSFTYQNPGGASRTATFTTEFEIDSYFYTGDDAPDGDEVPVEYEILPEGIGYARILSFFDNDLLTIELWERMIEDLQENEIDRLILDMRYNGGGRGFLANQMAAYFFDEELELGSTGFYDEDRGEFYFDPDSTRQFYLPPEELRYDGEIVVIVGPACASACEFFAYSMTLQNRATIIGHYPTAGLGGSVNDFDMPEGITVRYTVGRAVNTDGDIHIEGIGVEPDIVVPVTEDVILNEIDDLLQIAVDELN